MTDKKPNHDKGFNRYGRKDHTPGGFRCVYCKKRYLSYSDLSAHEAACPLRYTKKLEWANDIERAKRKERVRDNGRKKRE